MRRLPARLLLAFCFTAPCWAADNGALETAPPLEDKTSLEAAVPLEKPAFLEASNLTWLVDHTHSYYGGVFFRAFAETWRDKQVQGGGAIIVEEVQQPLWAVRLRIWVNDRLLTQAQYYPYQARNAESLGTRTAEFAYKTLMDMQTPK